MEYVNNTDPGRTGDGVLGRKIKKYRSLRDSDHQSAGWRKKAHRERA